MRTRIIPALSDNYICVADNDDSAVIVDPGDSGAILKFLDNNNLRLEAILITHRHHDHIGGLAEVLHHHPQAHIYAPDGCGLSAAKIVTEGEHISLLSGALTLSVIATPGHTLEHIAYYGSGLLLSGDTLFACGCGRVFEGTMAQMRQSLAKLAALPDDTVVYCGHEYTQSNIRFALVVDGNNEALKNRAEEVTEKRKNNKATVPFRLGEDKQINPFLRLNDTAIIAAVEKKLGRIPQDDDEVFSVLRCWKDSF